VKQSRKGQKKGTCRRDIVDKGGKGTRGRKGTKQDSEKMARRRMIAPSRSGRMRQNRGQTIRQGRQRDKGRECKWANDYKPGRTGSKGLKRGDVGGQPAHSVGTTQNTTIRVKGKERPIQH